VEAVVGGGLLGFAAPVLVGDQHRLPGIGNAEIDHHGRAATERRLGAPFEIVGRYAAHEGQFEMGVRIDAARHHIAAAGIDDLGPGWRFDGRRKGSDGLAFDQDIGAAGMIMVDHRAAADQDGHAISRQSIYNAAGRGGSST
jgi:hypothetical protein